MDYSHVIDRLKHEFGSGPNPEKRRALYAKLMKACNEHGDVAFKCLRTVAAEAKQKKTPDRYFCRAVLRRFQEHGYMPMLDLGEPK